MHTSILWLIICLIGPPYTMPSSRHEPGTLQGSRLGLPSNIQVADFGPYLARGTIFGRVEEAEVAWPNISVFLAWR